MNTKRPARGGNRDAGLDEQQLANGGGCQPKKNTSASRPQSTAGPMVNHFRWRPNRGRPVDSAWFAANTANDEYVRPPLPGEWDGDLAPPDPAYQWMVRVRARRHPVTRMAIGWRREVVRVPKDKGGLK